MKTDDEETGGMGDTHSREDWPDRLEESTEYIYQ